MSSKKFLGRLLNPQTMVWEYADGSGTRITEEQRLRLMQSADDNGKIRLIDFWRWKISIESQEVLRDG